MKKLLPRACPKCRGTLAQEQDGLTYDEERKVYSVEYACVTCSNRVYIDTKDLDGFATRRYN